MHTVEKLLIGILALLILFIVLAVLSLPFFNIGTPSTGERYGTVYRVSESGLLWKTTEVEVYLGGFKGSGESMAVNTTEFSIFNGDPEAKNKIEAANGFAKTGDRVCVKYEHKLFVGRWVSGTGYKIISIELAK